MKLDLQMFAEGDKTISLANLQKFKEKCDETYAKIGSEYNVLDLGALTDGQTITLNDDQLALFQADNTVIKITFNEVMTYLFKSYAQTYADVLRGDVYAMFIPSFDGVTSLSIHSTNNQVQLTQNTFNYASDNDFNQIQQWAKDTTTKIPNSKLNIDSELSSTSTNAVQNKVVNEALNNTIKKTGSSEAQIIQGDISIQGDLTVSGTTITANTETLVVKDNMIVTNSDGTTLSNLSGLFIKTGTSSGYAIVYDPSSNSVILGEGTIDSSNEVTVVASERKAIATRMDSQAIKNDNVLVWDDALKVLKDGGFSKTIVDSKYVKPSGGIPKTDLASVVQSSLNKADSALQSVPDASTTVKGIALLGASGGSARYGQKADVGLGNVVNTADSATPTQNGTTKFTTGGAYAMQSALQTAINGKQDALSSTQQNAINSGITQAKVAKYDGYETTINSKANASEVVKKSGDVMTGALSFQDKTNSNDKIILDGKEVEYELVYKTFAHGIHLWGKGGTADYVKKINLQLPDVGGLEKTIILPWENGTLITREQTDSNYLKRQPEVSTSDDDYMGECSVRPSTGGDINHLLLNLKGTTGGSACQIKVSDNNGPKLDIRYGYGSEPSGDFLRMASVNDLNNYLPLSGGQVNGVLSVYGPSSNGLIKVKSSSSYESSICFYHWDTAKLTLGICEDMDNKLGLYDTANAYGGGAKWYTLATEEYVNNRILYRHFIMRHSGVQHTSFTIYNYDSTRYTSIEQIRQALIAQGVTESSGKYIQYTRFVAGSNTAFGFGITASNSTNRLKEFYANNTSTATTTIDNTNFSGFTDYVSEVK